MLKNIIGSYNIFLYILKEKVFYKGIKMKRGRPRGTTKIRLNIYPEEFQKIIKYIDNNHTMKVHSKNNAKKAFYLLYYIGFRCHELTLLYVNHIHEMVKFQKISLGNNTKTKTARDAHISDFHVDILKEVFKEALFEDGRFALIRPWGSPMEQYSPSSLNELLNRIIHKALGEQYSTHSFRGGFITQLDEAGCSLTVIQEEVSHKNLATTARYIRVTEERKRRAVENLATVN
jgi:site-specific recombinase XerD